jgi:hypothetical protein
MKLSEYRTKETKESSIEIGDVYHVRLTKKHSIHTKDKEYRDKFVVIVGRNADSYYGILLINTKLGVPETEQYELKCSSYKYLDHNSFVNCSCIKHIDRETMISGESKGKLCDDDFQLIMDCVKNSKLIANKDKKRYGLI